MLQRAGGPNARSAQRQRSAQLLGPPVQPSQPAPPFPPSPLALHALPSPPCGKVSRRRHCSFTIRQPGPARQDCLNDSGAHSMCPRHRIPPSAPLRSFLSALEVGPAPGSVRTDSGGRGPHRHHRARHVCRGRGWRAGCQRSARGWPRCRDGRGSCRVQLAIAVELLELSHL